MSDTPVVTETAKKRSITANIPEDLHRKLRVYAATKDVTLSQLSALAIEEWVARNNIQ